MIQSNQYQRSVFIESHHSTGVPAGLLLRVAASHHDTSVPATILPKRRYRPRAAVPGGLLTRAQAAAKLNCSLRTLDGHVASGALRYVDIGHGKKRPRKMFTDADLDEFIANQTRKDVPTCQSAAIGARHTGPTTSKSTVIAFTDRRSARPGAKRKQ
jgi:hypothetical protein